MGYDSSNIFAKILRGEIPCDKVYEDEHVLAFRDIRPQAKVHALIIPKGAYISAQDFSAKASESEIVGFTRSIATVVDKLGLADGGYRIIANIGSDGGQEVPHYHIHILGGQKIGRMVNLPGA
jgi:diadenosine tetraphosphate (Ap4A) HIT family hydrolase